MDPTDQPTNQSNDPAQEDQSAVPAVPAAPQADGGLPSQTDDIALPAADVSAPVDGSLNVDHPAADSSVNPVGAVDDPVNPIDPINLGGQQAGDSADTAPGTPPAASEDGESDSV
ncbi:MAG TPA: hypothetical protein VK674_02600 [Candidatus Limnocylindria bacterium]|nr:hypothetical protein [Candidatus Limnocylindria bacterium]